MFFRPRAGRFSWTLLGALACLERTASHFDQDPADVGWFWKCGVAGSFRF